MILAVLTSTVSPTGCPKWSLTALKPFKSRSTIDTIPSLRSARAISRFK